MTEKDLAEAEALSRALNRLDVLPMPVECELRIRAALDAELGGARRSEPFGPVLTVEELARYLQVTPERVYEQLAELPAFEFAGEVRFLRTSIDEWIQERQKRFRRQVLESSVRSEGVRILRLA